VQVAGSFRTRYRGLRPRSGGRGLLVGGGAVHGVGMAEPLWLAFLDRTGRVLRVDVLPPGGFRRCPGAAWVLELPGDVPPPTAGARLVVRSLTSR